MLNVVAMPEHEAKEEAWVSPVEKKLKSIVEEYCGAANNWNEGAYTFLDFIQWLLDKGYLRIKTDA
jgi:hypothetical protein